MTNECDVVVIGAGAAGLTAAVEMVWAGLRVTILEARGRIGGRIFTVRDSALSAPIELGAEFIHGRSPEIWNRLKKHRVRTTEVDGDTWCLRNEKLTVCDFFSEVDEILQKMYGRKRDESFSEFLRRCCPDSGNNARIDEAKRWATRYVSGFNAADPDIVGVRWLVEEMRAEEKIEGDRSFRAENGYSDLIDIFKRELEQSGVTMCLERVVEKIAWNAHGVEVQARRGAGRKTFVAAHALITVPLGVLQAKPHQRGAIRFEPDLPGKKRQAIENVMMGKVIRVVFRFHDCFWHDLPNPHKRGSRTMRNLSFLLSNDEWFPTWWTMAPKKLPLLVGWAPFRSAERLSGKDESFLIERGLQSLSRVLGLPLKEIESQFKQAYAHDWQGDPYSRGAYSYGKVGKISANKDLGSPIAETLYFAGEASDVAGNNGTVHGAMASGERAAREIIRAAEKRSRSAGSAVRHADQTRRSSAIK